MTTRDEIERLVHVYGEAIYNQAEPDECELRYMALLSAIDRALAERDARISELQENGQRLVEAHNEWKREALDARDRVAVLEKALEASPCTTDSFDRLVWDCKERGCLRCAALAQRSEV